MLRAGRRAVSASAAAAQRRGAVQPAVVLERKGVISVRDVNFDEELGKRDVRIALKRVGICGSDVAYYVNGVIGPFVVNEPMVLGHEASGIVTEVGSGVTSLQVGDRVCMEPGIPNPTSKASRLGMYNLCPTLTGYDPRMPKVQTGFWATPPVHGVMRGSVVHPEDFTFKVPEGVSMEEAAMAEPVAIGMHAATKAQLRPGATCLVQGAGTIGCVTAMSALAAGAGRVFVSDVSQQKLDVVAAAGGPMITPIDASKDSVSGAVFAGTGGWGADCVFEATGNARAASQVFDAVSPGGTVVFIGHPAGPLTLDIVPGQLKEVTVKTIFRYAHVFPAVVALMAKRAIDVRPLISNKFAFADAAEAFAYTAEHAADCTSSCVKNMIIID